MVVIFKKYRGAIDVVAYEKTVNQFLREHLDAEVRSAFGSGFSITWENEGMNLGIDTKSRAFISYKNPTEKTVELIRMLAKNLDLIAYKEVFIYKEGSLTQTEEVKVDLDNLKVEDLK